MEIKTRGFYITPQGYTLYNRIAYMDYYMSKAII